MKGTICIRAILIASLGYLLPIAGPNFVSANDIIDTPPKFCELVLSEKYQKISGVAVQLKDGSIVEGSMKYGGLQPNYIWDDDHPSVQRHIKFAKEIGTNQDMSFWDKVNTITNYLGESVLTQDEYAGADYLALLELYREQGPYIPLGEYCEFGVGTCRANGLLLHMLLTHAGIESWYAYVTFGFKTERGADHAIVLVEYNGEKWVADSYFKEYHGRRYKDLFQKDPNDEYIPIKGLLPYPNYWIPKAQ